MSGAIEVAKTATDNIEQLLVEMLEGDHEDNEISLGRILCGKDEIQIQLKITRNRSDFLYSDEEDFSESHQSESQLPVFDEQKLRILKELN